MHSECIARVADAVHSLVQRMSQSMTVYRQCSFSPFVDSVVLLKKGKGSPYSITERRVPDLIPVLCSQSAGDVSHKPGDRLPLLSTRPAVTPATFKRTATSFAAW